MAIQIEDKWTIIDIASGNIPDTLRNKMWRFKSAYEDTSKGNQEHIYSANILDNYTEGQIKKILTTPNDLNVLKEIVQLCEQHDAFYFRIID